MLVGWDIESKTGYVIYDTKLRVSGSHWYAEYDELFRRSHGTIVEVGCWAHVRRKFVEAEKTSPREAHEAVARIKKLYAVEHEAKDLDVAARLAPRQQNSASLLAALTGWLDQLAPAALPKSPLGEAATYAAASGPR